MSQLGGGPLTGEGDAVLPVVQGRRTKLKQLKTVSLTASKKLMPELLRVNQWVSLLQEFLHCNGLGLFWCCAVTVLDHLCV